MPGRPECGRCSCTFRCGDAFDEEGHLFAPEPDPTFDIEVVQPPPPERWVEARIVLPIAHGLVRFDEEFLYLKVKKADLPELRRFVGDVVKVHGECEVKL
jgi:hypothetical protein